MTEDSVNFPDNLRRRAREIKGNEDTTGTSARRLILRVSRSSRGPIRAIRRSNQSTKHGNIISWREGSSRRLRQTSVPRGSPLVDGERDGDGKGEGSTYPRSRSLHVSGLLRGISTILFRFRVLHVDARRRRWRWSRLYTARWAQWTLVSASASLLGEAGSETAASLQVPSFTGYSLIVVRAPCSRALCVTDRDLSP